MTQKFLSLGDAVAELVEQLAELLYNAQRKSRRFWNWNLPKSLIDLIEDMPEGVDKKCIKSSWALSESFDHEIWNKEILLKVIQGEEQSERKW